MPAADEAASRTPRGEEGPRPAGRGGWLERLRDVGPGAAVAAAFIGPGTVTTATVAGARFGVALLWALLFSVLATLVLQEMAARLGLVTGRGLGEAVRARFEGRAARWTAAGLVLGAIVLGNAAYETGNLLGGALGARALAGGTGSPRGWALAIAAVAFALLWTGSYRVVERTLVGLVAVMAAVFFVTAAALLPDPSRLAAGLLVPSLPDGDALLVAVGLVGTTVVPYNLFLHASAVRERWAGPDDLPAARRDAAVSIAVGGAASMAVVVTAAAAGGAEVTDAADMAAQLEPLLGRWAEVFFSAGLLAAGVTSAVTAPLAAAWAAAGVLGWEPDLRSTRLRAVWGVVLGAGAAFAAAGVRPVPAILFAQVANGILLPGVAVFLLVVANDGRRMGAWKNGRLLNLAGGIVVLVTLVLGGRAVAGAL